jgi:AraC-like DNA-binding protein
VHSIPSISLDTSIVPDDRQFRHWAAHSENTALEQICPGPFFARGTLWSAGALCLAEAELDPFVSDRTAALVRSTGVDLVQLVGVLDGNVRFHDAVQDQTCSSPDLFVRDYAQPSRVTTTRSRTMTVYFARDFLEAASGPFAFQGVLPWCAETAMLGRMVRAVTASLPTSAATSADYYARTLRDLLTAAVTRVGRQNLPIAPEQVRQFERAKRMIAMAPPGSLSVDAMVLTLGISRTTLFRMFGAYGGVIAYDRLRRLRALQRDLSNPAERAPIADLGARHGFFDKAVLARSYRRAFGCSPRGTRMGALGRPIEAETVGARIRTVIHRAAE